MTALVAAGCAAPPVARPPARQPAVVQPAGEPSRPPAARAEAQGAPGIGTEPPGARVPAPPPEPSSVAELPDWAGDDLAGLVPALDAQCRSPRPPAPWPALCAEYRGEPRASAGALRAWLARRFQAWPLQGPGGEARGLITGYYEPLVTGSRTRTGDAQVPLYRKPRDLLRIELGELWPGAPASGLRGRLAGDRVVPYPARAEIDAQPLPGGQELVWIDDPVAAFFLQIQGSGRVRLPDGTMLRIGFADHNGHPYRAIGATLVERGALTREQADAEGIRTWLRANPAAAGEVMRSNPRVVFFRELPNDPGDPGPPGSLGVPLTAGRSLAIDPRSVPPGALMYVDTVHPLSAAPLRRTVLAQDTGAAITGAVRADLFWGFGEEAGRAAGAMRAPGRLWVLWPIEAGPPPGAAGR
jgi:membrane-bound lytic murein transglycosylase A